jgi:hypothetical protein
MTLEEMLFHIALHSGRYSDPRSLVRYQTQVYSQNGEDGIIAEIFKRIGSGNRFFVEIGCETGLENNTRFLLEQGWKGLWIDGSESNVNQAREKFHEQIANEALRVAQAIVTTDNIGAWLGGTPETIDFLSIDVDQNTSHIWRALTKPCRVACVEYNANIPSSTATETVYHPAAVWTDHWSSWYGAGLKALELLGREKKMHLVGCELAGVNAFFVNADETGDNFQQPFTAEFHYEPPRYYAVGKMGHKPSVEARKWLVR